MINTSIHIGTDFCIRVHSRLPLVDVWMYITPKKLLNTSKIQRWTYEYVLILKAGVSARRNFWRALIRAYHRRVRPRH